MSIRNDLREARTEDKQHESKGGQTQYADPLGVQLEPVTAGEIRGGRTKGLGPNRGGSDGRETVRK